MDHYLTFLAHTGPLEISFGFCRTSDHILVQEGPHHTEVDHTEPSKALSAFQGSLGAWSKEARMGMGLQEDFETSIIQPRMEINSLILKHPVISCQAGLNCCSSWNSKTKSCHFSCFGMDCDLKRLAKALETWPVDVRSHSFPIRQGRKSFYWFMILQTCQGHSRELASNQILKDQGDQGWQFHKDHAWFLPGNG